MSSNGENVNMSLEDNNSLFYRNSENLIEKQLMTIFLIVKRALIVHGVIWQQRKKVSALDTTNRPPRRSKELGGCV